MQHQKTSSLFLSHKSLQSADALQEGSTSSSRTWRPTNQELVFFYCEEVTKIRTLWKGKNPSRRFHGFVNMGMVLIMASSNGMMNQFAREQLMSYLDYCEESTCCKRIMGGFVMNSA
ncbi:hypothetical protein ACH5RR_026340 [Cinchona calisaya]|uniref:Uncharacterized protein n=1 Tax=Cinchona calisaya TaxID=153742 RepID=A0ABD2Z3D9_9GENT